MQSNIASNNGAKRECDRVSAIQRTIGEDGDFLTLGQIASYYSELQIALAVLRSAGALQYIGVVLSCMNKLEDLSEAMHTRPAQAAEPAFS